MSRLSTLEGTGMYGRAAEVDGDGPRPSFRRGGAGATQSERPARPNAYPGRCSNCDGLVEAGQGLLGPKEGGRWTVLHKGQCPLPLAEPESGPTVEVHPGIYTLETNHGHRTFRVVLQGPDAGFAPGKTVLEYLAGSDNDGDYRGFAFIKGGRLQVWNRFRTERFGGLLRDAEDFLRDPEAALEAKHCLRCGRTLTTPDSIAAGMGPECYKRGV